MTIEIYQCSCEHYWYNNKVGEIIEVNDCGDKTDWEVAAKPGLHILKSDCREIIALGRLTA